MNDRMHGSSANAKTSGQLGYRDATDLVEFSYLDHLSRRQFRPGVFTTLDAALRVLVRHIVGVCSKKQVSHGNAGWRVAGMEHVQSVWDWAACDGPSNSMSGNHYAVDLQIAVPVCVPAAGPELAAAFIRGTDVPTKADVDGRHASWCDLIAIVRAKTAVAFTQVCRVTVERLLARFAGAFNFGRFEIRQVSLLSGSCVQMAGMCISTFPPLHFSTMNMG